MILPRSTEERDILFRNVVRECQVSADTRRARNRRLRNWRLLGTDSDTKCRRNKLDEWCDTLASYLYAPEAVRFGVTYPPHYGDDWIEHQDAAGEEIHRLYHDTDAALQYAIMVDWATTYDSMVGKVIVSENEPRLEVLPDPADFGVWRENLDSIDAQEAFVHEYEMDLAAFERIVRGAIADPKLAQQIIDEGHDSAVPGTGGGSNLAPGLPRILLAQASPNMIGAVQNLQDTVLAQPMVRGRVVKLGELWIRDDVAVDTCKRCHGREGDPTHTIEAFYEHDFESGGEMEWEWRVVQHMPSTERMLWSTLNTLLPQRHPFRLLSLNPVLGYLWGVSPMEKLLVMQAWGEEKIAQHDMLLNLQLDPPIAIVGMSNIPEERAKLLRLPGGTFAMPFAPGVDIKRLAPETPPDAAGMTELIDRWFDRAGGLPHGASGQTEANVRSAGQQETQAALSSPRANRRAMRVEDCLEDIATDMLRLQRRVSKRPLRIPLMEPGPDGATWKEFYLSQMPGDFTVRVSAHSASPLYQNQARQIAMGLYDRKAIDADMLIEITDPPLADMLKTRARRKMKAQGEMQKKAVEIKEREARAKEEKARHIK